MSATIGLRNAFSRVIANMSGEQAERTVTEMAMVARAYSDEITPIDTSNLINSGFVRPERGPYSYKATVGYTAKYAGWVHEMPGTLKGKPRADFGRTSRYSEFGPVIPVNFGGGTKVGNYWDPNAEPKFLEKGRDKMISEDAERIIKKNMEPKA